MPELAAQPGPPAALSALRVERTDHLAEVVLIGPGKGNAMGPDFWREMPLVFRELDADPDVRAVLVRGDGEHFSYGLDLAAMAGTLALDDGGLAGARAGFLDRIMALQDALNAVEECRKPVVAAVAGWCIGGGSI